MSLIAIVIIPIVVLVLWLISGMIKKNKRVVIGALILLFIFLINIFFLCSNLLNNIPLDKVAK